MEIDWDMANPNEIFKAHENISKCFKNIYSASVKWKNNEKNYGFRV